MHRLRHDLRVTIRSLSRAAAFATTAVLTLALGIGLSTTVFTVADALLLRRLPVRDQDRVLLLWGETRDGRFANFPLGLKDVRSFQRRTQTLGDVAFVEFRGATLTPIRVGERVYSAHSSLVSGNFFDVLGSRAAIGRALRPNDDVVGAAPVVLLSHRAWRQQFSSDSAVVGKSITMLYTGRSYTIVGVMPQGLEYPRGTDLWAPAIAFSTAGGFTDRLSFDLLGRLQPAASAAQASAELTTFFAQSEIPAFRSVRGVANTLADIVLGDTRPAMLVVILAAALLLFITCVNVANLLLVRALSRTREFVVRSALGAGRGRTVGQLLGESGVLSLAGGFVGAALAIGGVKTFTALAPASVPRIDEVGVSGGAVIAAVVITATAMLLSSVAPAFYTSRVSAYDSLRSGSRHSSSGRVRLVAEVLVIAQVALATVSLTTAGLVTRGFIKLEHADLSFEPQRLLVATLAMRPDQLAEVPKQLAALDAVVSAAAAVPGVLAVSPVLNVPFSGSGSGIDGRLSVPGQSEEDAGRNPVVNMEVAAPNYFTLLGTPVLRGRAFSAGDRDGATRVVVVSSSIARYFWPNSDPIGKHLGGPGGELTVIGVVPDTRYRDLLMPRPTAYVPLRQSPFPIVPATLLIRTAGARADVVTALRHAIADAQPGVTVVNASSIEDLLDGPRAQPRLIAVVLALFAAAAVSLAAIGLFAIIATMVRQRTRELGIRMALGATAGDVRTMVMGRGLLLAVLGAAIGMVVALAASRLLSALLLEISPTDATTLVSVAAVMLAVAAVASIIPMRLSERIDPVIALRNDV